MSNFNIAIDKVLRHEGKYTVDDGGKTKYGISQKWYPEVDVKNLTLDGAKKIYLENYWKKILGSSIKNQKVANEILDIVVNMGVKGGVKLVQQVVGSYVDGIFGPHTLEAVNSIDDEELFMCKLKMARIREYVDLCNKESMYREYLRGWLNRVLDDS